MQLGHVLRQLQHGGLGADLRGDGLDVVEHRHEGDDGSEDRDKNEQDPSPLTRIHRVSFDGLGAKAGGMGGAESAEVAGGAGGAGDAEAAGGAGDTGDPEDAEDPEDVEDLEGTEAIEDIEVIEGTESGAMAAGGGAGTGWNVPA